MGYALLFTGKTNFFRFAPMMKIIKQYPMEFYGVRFLIYKTDERKLLVPLQHMCEILGLDFRSQLRRIKFHKVLSDNLFKIVASVQQKNGEFREQSMACITIQVMPFWLSWVDVMGIKKRLKDKVVSYQRGVVEMLWLDNLFELLPDDLIDESDEENFNVKKP